MDTVRTVLDEKAKADIEAFAELFSQIPENAQERAFGFIQGIVFGIKSLTERKGA